MAPRDETKAPASASGLPEFGETHLYVLTLWREDPRGPCRAALRSAGGGARLGFANLEHLAAYLLRLEDADGAPAGPTPPAPA